MPAVSARLLLCDMPVPWCRQHIPSVVSLSHSIDIGRQCSVIFILSPANLSHRSIRILSYCTIVRGSKLTDSSPNPGFKLSNPVTWDPHEDFAVTLPPTFRWSQLSVNLTYFPTMTAISPLLHTKAYMWPMNGRAVPRRRTVVLRLLCMETACMFST